MNKWMGMGRLTAEPEVGTTAGGTAVAKYTLAVNRAGAKDGQQEADFIRCVCFGKSAEFVRNYLHKGMRIAVEGRIQTGSYEKDGTRFYTTDIIVERSWFCESKGNAGTRNRDQESDPAEKAYIQQERKAIQNEPQYIEVDDSELPF